MADFNRSGVPLVEIVTEPDFRSVDEVDQYLKKLQKIVRYLGISGTDMEKGSMRLEPSISIAQIAKHSRSYKHGKDFEHKLPDYRVELKNINSFRFARKALEYEIQRQTEILEKGETPTQQTRGWSEAKNATIPQREKEGESDYRYFPEPDIPPLRISNEQLAIINKQIPELPDAKSTRFQKEFSLTEHTSNLLAEDKSVADYFEEAVKNSLAASPSPLTPIIDVANWIINKKIDINQTLPAELIQQILRSKQSSQIDESELEKIIVQVFAENPKAVEDYKKGKLQVVGYLIGVCLKKGNFHQAQIKEAVEKKLRNV